MRKVIAIVLLIPATLVAIYVVFLAASYISKDVRSGSAYGFQIGQSKAQVAGSLDAVRREYPAAEVYVTYGPRVGDNFTAPASGAQLTRLQPHDQWKVLLDGPEEFDNVVRLTFVGDRLVGIYRHRQYFELP